MDYSRDVVEVVQFSDTDYVYIKDCVASIDGNQCFDDFDYCDED